MRSVHSAALKLQLQAGKTPEQLLAEQGIDPKTNSRLLEKVERLLRESAERTERLASAEGLFVWQPENPETEQAGTENS